MAMQLRQGDAQALADADTLEELDLASGIHFSSST
jgi:hypothetical protein